MAAVFRAVADGIGLRWEVLVAQVALIGMGRGVRADAAGSGPSA
jgi:hypothetical protein